MKESFIAIHSKPKSAYETNNDYKYGRIQVIHIEPKLKALVKIHDSDLN